MSTLRTALHAVNVVALGVWTGAMVMTGVAAAVTFPTVKALAPKAGAGFENYTGEHWRLIAGKVAGKLFVISDIVQFSCAALAVVTLGALVGGSLTKGKLGLPMLLRVGTLAIACTVLGGWLLLYSPSMYENLRGYWDAAQAGDNAKAATFQAAFDAAHGTASTLMITCTLAALGALVAAAIDRHFSHEQEATL